MIKFDKIVFKYKDLNVLNGISFKTIKNGLVTIIGENGSGKSTLINQITNKGRYKGTINLKSKNIKEYSGKELSKIISYLPQKINFPEEISVYDVIKIGRNPHTNIWGFLTTKDKHIIDNYSKLTGVYGLLNKNFSSISGGQQQRVLLSMVLCQETEVIILDEPTNHLDIKYQIEFFKLVNKLKKDKLFIITTHNINLASKYSDQIILLDKGKVLIEGNKNIINEKNIRKIFGIKANIKNIKGNPIIVDMEV